MNLSTDAFAQFIRTCVLASAFAVQPAYAEFLVDANTEPAWIAQALEHGVLDRQTIDLSRHPIFCRPAACPAAWARAMNWLRRDSLSVETIPEFGNDVLKFKNAVGHLKTYPDIEIRIRMKIRAVGGLVPEIEIEQVDHSGGDGLKPEQLIQDATIFADFKSYVLKASGGKP
jgi:hypothetical protein